MAAGRDQDTVIISVRPPPLPDPWRARVQGCGSTPRKALRSSVGKCHHYDPTRITETMAKPNYAHQKKLREEAARKKREEKQQRRQPKKDDSPPPAT